MRRRLAGGLVVGAAALLALARLLAPAGPPTGPAPAGPLDLGTLADPRLAAQVQAVVDSMDRTGRPPEGVAQGGRRGGPRGLFDNAEGKLPRQPRGYYTEADVWPRPPGKSRGTHRLVLGRGGEVYYTADHYRTFSRLR